MRPPEDDDPLAASHHSGEWGIAIAFAISIVICLAAFAWIYVEIDPFLSDFMASDTVVTPDPDSTPIDASEIDGSSDDP